MQKLITLAVIWATLNTSAYAPTGNPTASGVMPQVGMCAVDKINGVTVPFGTKIYTEDGRTLVVTDRFGDSRNNCLDIFMATESECWEFGRRELLCEIQIEE